MREGLAVSDIRTSAPITRRAELRFFSGSFTLELACDGGPEFEPGVDHVQAETVMAALTMFDRVVSKLLAISEGVIELDSFTQRASRTVSGMATMEAAITVTLRAPNSHRVQEFVEILLDQAMPHMRHVINPLGADDFEKALATLGMSPSDVRVITGSDLADLAEGRLPDSVVNLRKEDDRGFGGYL